MVQDSALAGLPETVISRQIQGQRPNLRALNASNIRLCARDRSFPRCWFSPCARPSRRAWTEWVPAWVQPAESPTAAWVTKTHPVARTTNAAMLLRAAPITAPCAACCSSNFWHCLRFKSMFHPIWLHGPSGLHLTPLQISRPSVLPKPIAARLAPDNQALLHTRRTRVRTRVLV